MRGIFATHFLFIKIFFMAQAFSFGIFLRGFLHAFNGLKILVKKERNFKVQIFAAIIVMSFCYLFNASATEVVIILICIGGVLSLEILNSAIEKLCDFVHADYHESVKVIKDISAAAVLLFSFISLMIGTIIFLPKFIALF
jgi:diacylglycerol kinase